MSNLVQMTLIRERLSDGSHVYNVQVPATYLSATSEDDAVALLQKITDAINSHTLDEIASFHEIER